MKLDRCPFACPLEWSGRPGSTCTRGPSCSPVPANDCPPVHPRCTRLGAVGGPDGDPLCGPRVSMEHRGVALTCPLACPFLWSAASARDTSSLPSSSTAVPTKEETKRRTRARPRARRGEP
jgi:hypothetical protein